EQASAEVESCCESTRDVATELKGTSVIGRIGKGLHYAATDLVRDTTVWLLIGLFFAALVQTYVPADFMAKWGDGILAMLVMVLISVPMYICATASTPIAAGLLLAGVSPGAVLVFMLAGPATNIATLGVVTKELGKRALYGYLGGVLGVALVSGILVNYLVETFGFVVMPQIGEQHELLPAGIVYTSGVVLAILMAKVFLDKLPKNWWRRDCCS
ncbi:permease, partial [Shewanella sp. 0m-11]